MKLLEKGSDPNDAASQTIGDVNTLDDPLREYIHKHIFTDAKMRTQAASIDENGFRVRDMTGAEALAVRAGFMAHDRRSSEALQMLEEALKADPKLGIACDGLSFLALQQGKSEEAEKWSCSSSCPESAGLQGESLLRGERPEIRAH